MEISNDDQMNITKHEPWSTTIERRLGWYERVGILPPETPARTAIEEFKRKTKKPRGDQITTWLYKDLKELNLTPEVARQKTQQNGKEWSTE